MNFTAHKYLVLLICVIFTNFVLYKSFNGHLNIFNLRGLFDKVQKNGVSSMTKFDKVMKILKRNTSDTDDKSSVIYLVQGPAKHAQIWRTNTEVMGDSAYLIYHSYDKPCNMCLFQNTKTWADGRNLLLRNALLHDKLDTFKYFSFLDSDVTLRCKTKRNCWQTWHEHLLDRSTQYAQMAPKMPLDPIDEGTIMQTCVDFAIVTVHHRALHIVMPLPTYLVHEGWWYISVVQFIIFNKCLPFLTLSHEKWRWNNPLHSSYPSWGKTGQASYNHSIVLATLEHEYPELGPWGNETYLDKRCYIQREINMNWKIPDTCEKIMLKYFQDWLLSTKKFS